MESVILIYEHNADFNLVGVFTEMGAELFASYNKDRSLTGIRHKLNHEDDGEIIDLYKPIHTLERSR